MGLICPLGTFCPLERFVLWDILSLGMFCPWDILSLGTFCPYRTFSLGRFVWDVLYVHLVNDWHEKTISIQHKNLHLVRFIRIRLPYLDQQKNYPDFLFESPSKWSGFPPLPGLISKELLGQQYSNSVAKALQRWTQLNCLMYCTLYSTKHPILVEYPVLLYTHPRNFMGNETSLVSKIKGLPVPCMWCIEQHIRLSIKVWKLLSSSVNQLICF